MRGALLALVAVVGMVSGCRTGAPARPRPATAGLTVVIDQRVDGRPGGAEVDDRRVVEVTAAGAFDVAGVDPALELSTLVIEAVDRPGALRVARCALVEPRSALATAERLAAADDGGDAADDGADDGGRHATDDGEWVPALAPVPTLRCQASGRRGRQLVRVAYRTEAARWRVGYQVTGAGGPVDDATTAVTVTPRYLVDLALGGARPADVVLRALPADDGAAVEVWRGSLTVGAGEVTAVGAAGERRGRVRRVYIGAGVARPGGPLVSGATVRSNVWRELAYERAATDVPGELRVSLADGDARRWHATEVLPAVPGARLVRAELGPDPELTGFRQRLVHERDGRADEVRFSITNRGAAARRVIVEEPLEPLGRPAVRFAAPAPGVVGPTSWQLELEVPAGGVERAAVLLQYPEAD